MYIEQLIVRYHQINHILSGYDFHSLLISQKLLVMFTFNLIKTKKLDSNRFEMSFLSWGEFLGSVWLWL